MRLNRNEIGRLSWAAAVVSLACGGCASMLFRGGEKETDAALEELTENETPLVGDYAYPWGTHPEKVEAVALCIGLDGTGEDPPQSPQRAAMLDDMQRRNVPKPNELLRSRDNALVLLRGFLPPGAQKGDKFDIEVRTPTRSDAKSLRGGYVLSARMTQLAALGGQIREGRVLAEAEGAVLIDPSSDEEDALAAHTQGRILGGGTVLKSRDLGLMIGEAHQSFHLVQSIAASINKRFQSYDEGRKQGVAEAKNFGFVRLRVHPRYKDNLPRYVKVVRALSVRETPAAMQERLQLLETQLLDPLTSATAAVRLEAIGDESAIKRLRAGLESADPEVRFYSAEALAYLDQTDCVEALAEAARDEPAFRAYALVALSAMDDVVAYDALRSLLDSPSAETRYGAFRALWAMNPSDPMIRGEQLGGSFAYHVIDGGGPPMVHVTRTGRPEVVLFGGGQNLRLPLVLDAGTSILVNGLEGDEITVSRFRDRRSTLRRAVSTDLDGVIRAIVEVGGEYPDVVQALQQAKRDGALEGRLAVDAVPQDGRVYDGPSEQADPQGAEVDADLDASLGTDESYRVSNPLPDLFSKKR
ncbi:flagellar basal body P-ring protein FlgI [Botrimarina sp.]|uniref:flagellar basal body P-ring protein FlgI n=1 Tax=Botrimarina sp. TaxID=2795802 RepID=UPI0032EBE3FF